MVDVTNQIFRADYSFLFFKASFIAELNANGPSPSYIYIPLLKTIGKGCINLPISLQAFDVVTNVALIQNMDTQTSVFTQP